MQPRNQKNRHGLIATLPLALLVAACGTATSPTTRATSSATAAATPSQIPAPTPTAVPTAATEPPLAVLVDGAGDLKVLNGQGVEQWSLTTAAMLKIFGLTAKNAQTPNFYIGKVVAGSYVYLFNTLYEATSGKVAVLSRTGALLGLATSPPDPAGLNGLTMVFSPSSPEWAWLVDQSPANQVNNSGQGDTYRHHGVINVGGLGEPDKVVYRWLAPAGNVETLDGWINAGIIVHREQYLGVDCNIFYQPGSAWFTLNSSTGTLTQLAAGGNDVLLDASSDDTVDAIVSDAQVVLINGVTYAESKSQVTFAFNSPDGSYVAVDRYSQTRCDLNAEGGKNTVEMVDVAAKTHVDLPNLSAIAWLSSSEFVADPPDGSTWLYSLTGKPITELCPAGSVWSYAGDLS